MSRDAGLLLCLRIGKSDSIPTIDKIPLDQSPMISFSPVVRDNKSITWGGIKKKAPAMLALYLTEERKNRPNASIRGLPAMRSSIESVRLRDGLTRKIRRSSPLQYLINL
jgi:hypothetical protein